MQNDDDKQISELNQAMADVIRSEAAVARLSQAELSDRTGYSLATINRILGGKSKFNLDQIEKIGAALRLDPREMMRRAVERRAVRMSEAAPDNVTQLQPRKRVEDMTVEELEQQKHAATVDPEMDQPEQFD